MTRVVSIALFLVTTVVLLMGCHGYRSEERDYFLEVVRDLRRYEHQYGRSPIKLTDLYVVDDDVKAKLDTLCFFGCSYTLSETGHAVITCAGPDCIWGTRDDWDSRSVQ